ncbi:DMT family transporter [Mangrovicoccus algicola]|uniref:DMT family transporter n=1 Tax=Mangrovicoccus algicola TaxID=2771008 RepID=A0A8J7CGP7_9RHOB|nr:DMT family transporter [Mangrovicoccus algicola]MBE3637335.1 DMT family transporter [Mangrovicoccus algicola]
MTSSSENIRGAVLMAACMGAFATNDALMRSVAGELPVSQAIFLRGAVACILLLVILLVTRRSLPLPGRDARRTILVRSAAEAGTGTAVVVALNHMPLAVFSAVGQAAPLSVTLAGALFLREPIGWRRLTAIFAGFLGVLVIIRPGTDGFSAWSLVALLAVAFLTLRDLASRQIPAAIPPTIPAFCGALATTAMAVLWGCFVDWQPVPPRVLAVLAVAGVSLVLAYLLAIQSMRAGELSFVAPFRYTGLLWAISIGVIFLGEGLDIYTVTGSAIVVAAGGYSLWREIRLRRLQARPVIPRP